MIVKGCAIELNPMSRLCKRMYHKGSIAVNECLNSLKESASLVIGVFNRVKRLIIRAFQVALSCFNGSETHAGVSCKFYKGFRVCGLGVGVFSSGSALVVVASAFD